MIKNLAMGLIVMMSLFLTGEVFGQEKSETKKFVGEGAVVAFQKSSRYPGYKGASGGPGILVEYWIVRIDQWPDGIHIGDKYILVEVDLYERALSEAEINSKSLRFRLRERREDENCDCIGTIPDIENNFSTRRPATIADYERTEPGREEFIPPVMSLPCLIIEHTPVVIK
jgi:hypothetical protein